MNRPMKHIASKDNALFKMLSRIESSARERREQGRTVLDGIHLLEACISAGFKPESVVVRESSLDAPAIAPLLQDGDVVSMSDTLFDRISPVKNPTGILALISIPLHELPEQPEFCIFLEEIQDPGNLGAILRSAAAAGATDAFLSRGCADPWSPKVLRAGMGAHFSIRIHADSDLANLVRNFHGNAIALSLDADISLFDLDLKGKTGFVIGNEGAGISREILDLAAVRARIPMPGRIESLNAAQAASICFFERVRQMA